MALGANFYDIEERGATDTGCLLATSDTEIGKIGPSPSGCGENPLNTSLSSQAVVSPQPSSSASSERIFAQRRTHLYMRYNLRGVQDAESSPRNTLRLPMFRVSG